MLPAGVAAHISTENDGPSARAYSKRLERAKTSNTLTGKKEGAGAGSGTGFGLNLSDVKQTEASAAGVEGEHKVGESAQTMRVDPRVRAGVLQLLLLRPDILRVAAAGRDIARLALLSSAPRECASAGAPGAT